MVKPNDALCGYGGFNVSLTPAFSIANAVWMENGDVYAVTKFKKVVNMEKNGMMQELKCKNKMYLMISAAEYLIAQNILPQIFLPFVVGQMEVC
jgi:prolyl oligopeptidase